MKARLAILFLLAGLLNCPAPAPYVANLNGTATNLTIAGSIQGTNSATFDISAANGSATFSTVSAVSDFQSDAGTISSDGLGDLSINTLFANKNVSWTGIGYGNGQGITNTAHLMTVCGSAVNTAAGLIYGSPTGFFQTNGNAANYFVVPRNGYISNLWVSQLASIGVGTNCGYYFYTNSGTAAHTQSLYATNINAGSSAPFVISNLTASFPVVVGQNLILGVSNNAASGFSNYFVVSWEFWY